MSDLKFMFIFYSIHVVYRFFHVVVVVVVSVYLRAAVMLPYLSLHKRQI